MFSFFSKKKEEKPIEDEDFCLRRTVLENNSKILQYIIDSLNSEIKNWAGYDNRWSNESKKISFELFERELKDVCIYKSYAISINLGNEDSYMIRDDSKEIREQIFKIGMITNIIKEKATLMQKLDKSTSILHHLYTEQEKKNEI
jgi:hypothetical protein